MRTLAEQTRESYRLGERASLSPAEALVSELGIDPGLFAGRYRVERQLGSGGMGTVLLAEDTRHRRHVAIKVLSPELTSTTSAERFLREIETLAGLSHPNILPMFDSGEATGTLYYVTPVVEGGSLRDHLEQHGPMAAEDAARLGEEIAEALAYAHAQGVLHRDIKPENILLSSGHALVADFGIARALAQANVAGERGDASNRLTTTGMIVGTPSYMSPEQFSGERDIDGRSDIYALGIVLAEMLTARPPFANAIARFASGPKGGTPSARLHDAGVTAPSGLAALIDRAAALAPEDRFSTAAEMAAALRISTGSRVASRASQRGTRAVAMGAAIVALLVGGYILRRSHLRAQVLDRDLVAVAPFDVVGGAEAVWHEGLMDLLSRAIDGAGAVRSVTPTVVVRNWRGRADRDGAMQLAHVTGAATVVFGTLLRSGGDSVRLLASVFGADDGETIEELEVRDAADRMDRLVDSAAVRTLRALSERRPLGPPRHATVSGRSLPAIKTYLRGEQWYRAGRYDSAVAHATRAIALDAGYALAYSLRARALGAMTTALDSIPALDEARAGALAAGLRGRDSLFIAAEAGRIGILRAQLAGTPDALDSARVLYDQYLGALEELVRRYPDDAEGWLFLGEARHHAQEYGGDPVSDSLRLETFQRAVALDSLLRPAYFHTVPILVSKGRVREAQRYAAAYMEDTTVAIVRGVFPILLEAGRLRPGDERGLRAFIDTMPGDVIAQTITELEATADERQLMLPLGRSLLERRHVWKDTSAYEQFKDTALLRKVQLPPDLSMHGRLRESDSIASDQRGASPPVLVIRALLGVVPRIVMDTIAQHWRKAQPGDPRIGPPRPPWQYLVYSLAWYSSIRDTAALVEAALRADSLFTKLRAPDSARTTADYVRRSARAHLALARGDSAGALRAFQALPEGVAKVSLLDVPITAELLSRAGSHAEAYARIERAWRREAHVYGGEFRGMWRLYRARYAKRAGHPSDAAREFAYVAELWSRADRYAAPVREEALAGLRATVGR